MDLVFMDPPFNLGKRYGSQSPAKDRRQPTDYESSIRLILDEAVRVLAPGGALYLYHIPEWAVRFASYLMRELSFRHWITVSMKNGFPPPGRLYPAHYALLYMTAGSPKWFVRPKIPAPRCRHCDGYVRDYGGYTQYIEAGLNLSDIWDDVSPVRHKANKHRTANELPPLIAERVLGVSGFAGGIFLDPFMGSGTAVLAAHRKGMRVIACDIEAENTRIAAKRIAQNPKEEPA
ncbi:MAG TPA: site-specific DNA-methyltransferase [Longimicrobiales bacterium]|nr:site-specific DNA-methyltransferase [Longimicrobiales bacterium]